VTSTCFEQPSIHPQENLYTQFYGTYSYVHISIQIDVSITHPAVDQTAYIDA